MWLLYIIEVQIFLIRGMSHLTICMATISRFSYRLSHSAEILSETTGHRVDLLKSQHPIYTSSTSIHSHIKLIFCEGHWGHSGGSKLFTTTSNMTAMIDF